MIIFLDNTPYQSTKSRAKNWVKINDYAKLSNSQLNKLKSGTKNGTEVTWKISSNFVSDPNDENNLPHKLLLYQQK